MVYNANKKTIEIVEPEFDVKTQSVLVKSAGWLLHGLILKSISPYLSYPVSQDIEKMKSDVNLMLSNYKIIDGVSLQGNLSKISVTNLLLVPGAIRLEANITGKIGLKVEDLKF